MAQTREERGPSIEKRLDAVNAATITARNTTTAMLVLAITLAATVVATDDFAILLGTVKVLPELGVELPVVVAFLVAPPVFIFLHANVLLQLEVLAERLRSFYEAIPYGSDATWADLVHGFAFTQFHRPPPATTVEKSFLSPDRLHRFFLWIIIWSSIIAAPILLLISIQISFVRFQSVYISIFHAVIVTIDLVFLIWHYFSVRRYIESAPILPLDRILGAQLVKWLSRGVVILAAVLVGAIIWTQAMPPGWYDARHYRFYSVGFDHDPRDIRRDKFDPWPTAGDLIRWKERAGVLDVLCAEVKWGCRFINLPFRTLVNIAAKPSLLDVGLFLGYRRFRYADFRESRLQGVDFRFSNLTGANLHKAHLQNAILSYANLQGTDLSEAHLESAQLEHAKLGCSKLHSSSEERCVDLRRAHLLRANLKGASLNGADLSGSNMDGADISGAWLIGVNLVGANIQNLKCDEYTVLWPNTDVGSELACQAGLRLPSAVKLNKHLLTQARGNVVLTISIAETIISASQTYKSSQIRSDKLRKLLAAAADCFLNKRFEYDSEQIRVQLELVREDWLSEAVCPTPDGAS